jgi:hypothetical protein
MKWVSTASTLPWVFVGRNLRSLTFLYIFMEDLTNRPSSFWEPIDDLVSSFHRHLRLCLHFERMKNARFKNLKIIVPISKLFKLPKYHYKPRTRESAVTINLSYQLESFSSCFGLIQAELNVRILHHTYELLQLSARYKILNTTEHERQDRSDWPSAGNTMEESAYTDKLKHVPTMCF